VLIVEDRPRALAALDLLLRSHGFHVLGAPDVEGGLALLDEWSVDAIVADLRLGDGPDGMTLLDAALQWHPGIRSRFLLTSDPIGEPLAAANGATWIERGADGWTGRLVALLRAALD
jgi:CheY-like chemotaxis protein